MLATIIGTVGLVAVGFIGGVSALLFLGFRLPSTHLRAVLRTVRELREGLAEIRRDVGE
jgi:hypothetical protein